MSRVLSRRDAICFLIASRGGDDDVTSIRRVRAARDKTCFHRSTYATGSN